MDLGGGARGRSCFASTVDPRGGKVQRKIYEEVQRNRNRHQGFAVSTFGAAPVLSSSGVPRPGCPDIPSGPLAERSVEPRWQPKERWPFFWESHTSASALSIECSRSPRGRPRPYQVPRLWLSGRASCAS